MDKLKNFIGSYDTAVLKQDICLNSTIIKTSMAVSLVVSVLTLNYLSSIPDGKTKKFLGIMNWANVIISAFNILRPSMLASQCADIAPWILLVGLLLSLITASVTIDTIRKQKVKTKTGNFLLTVNIIFLIVVILALVGGAFSGKNLLALISVSK